MVNLRDLQDMIDGRRNKSSAGPAVAAWMVGLTTGMVAGILLAPRSGRETRDQLMGKAKEGMQKGKDKASELKDTAKVKMSQAADTAKIAAEEGKRAIRETKERSANGRPNPPTRRG